jgi:hypothetical protein
MTGYSSDSGAKLKNRLAKYHRAICPVEESRFGLDSCQVIRKRGHKYKLKAKNGPHEPWLNPKARYSAFVPKIALGSHHNHEESSTIFGRNSLGTDSN